MTPSLPALSLSVLVMSALLVPVKALGEDPDAADAAPVQSSERPRTHVVRGSLDPASIRERIRQHDPTFQACYQDGRRSNPSLAGTVKFRFVIAPTGKVASIEVAHATLKSDPVVDCLAAELMRLQFGKPEGGGRVVVGYRFRFSPEG